MTAAAVQPQVQVCSRVQVNVLAQSAWPLQTLTQIVTSSACVDAFDM